MILNRRKIGRNELCPCGSQKKFKKCCLSAHSTTDQNKSKAQQLSQERLLKRIQHNKVQIVDEDQPTLKMSEVILHLAEDVLEAAQSKSDRKVAIDMACIAWNLSVISDEDSFESAFEAMYNTMNVNPSEGKEVLYEIISGMIHKKFFYYPSIKRMVVDYEVVDTKTDFILNIASTTA